MHRSVWQQLLKRPKASYKYDFGHVLVIGGSPGMVGASFLAGMAALRVGSGLVTIASPREVTDKLEHRVVEIMTLALPAKPAQAMPKLKEFIAARKVSSIVIGPGMEPRYAAGLLPLLKPLELPMVLDGGALAALPDHMGLLQEKRAEVILTPHLGEFQRFFLDSLPIARRKLLSIAKSFAKTQGVTLVLKGNPTFVIQPNGRNFTNNSNTPALATAGTGDVLAGMIAGLIAQGMPVEPAAKAAVYLHGLAGKTAAAEKTEAGVIASDVIENIPAALKSLS